MRANARLVSDVVSSQTPLATGEVDIAIAGDEWLTAVLTGDPDHPQTGRHALDPTD